MTRWLVLGLVLAAVAAWWWRSMQVREQAVHAARQGCQRFSVQLLDETVALRRLQWVRGGDGRLHVRWLYRFEFSRTGGERYGGHVALLGTRVMDVHLDAVDADDPPPRNRLQG